MNEQFDIDLKNHISDIFENYEDLSADAGWNLLRERFPEKKKDRAIVWWYSIAAGLLLFAGLLFLLDKKAETVASKHHIKKTSEVLAKKVTPQGNARSRSSKEDMDATSGDIISGKSSPYQTNAHQPETSTFNQSFPLIDVTPPVVPEINVGESIASITEKAHATLPMADSANNNALTKTAEAAAITAPLRPAVTNAVTDPVLKMMADDKAKQAKTNITKEARKAENVIALSPYAATYFNYAKGSSNDVNVGAGVTTDIKLNHKLRFSTGIAIAQNTLNFGNNSIPQKVATAAFANVVVSSPATSNLNGSTGTIGDAASYGFYLNNYKANLIGLDIPVNLKYQVNPALSISAGISSGTFINETYTTSIFNGAANTNSAFTNNQHFGTFDFAKTVNFSFGLGYPIGGNHIIVEPFLKYPIGGLGSQNLKFGASGLNLKFNFSTIKK